MCDQKINYAIESSWSWAMSKNVFLWWQASVSNMYGTIEIWNIYVSIRITRKWENGSTIYLYEIYFSFCWFICVYAWSVNNSPSNRFHVFPPIHIVLSNIITGPQRRYYTPNPGWNRCVVRDCGGCWVTPLMQWIFCDVWLWWATNQ